MPQPGEVASFPPFTFDLHTGELRKQGRVVKLHPQPARLLALLVARAEELVAREEIREELWKDDTIVDFDLGINSCIRQIRTALGDDAQIARYVETLPRKGYRFKAAVVWDEPPAAGPAAQASGRPIRKRHPGWILTAVGASALLLVAMSFLRQARPPPTESLSADRIAVLPFTVRGSGEFAYLSEGMVDLLSTTLGGEGDQRAVDPKSLLSFVSREAGAPLDPERGRVVARHFRAGRYLLGTIVESGGRLRIQASLYDASTERNVITESTVEGTADELFSLVDRLTAELLVTERRGPGGRLARVASATTDSLPALKAYLEGEHAMRTPRDFARARKAYQRAVELDPTFALAWFRLAFVAGWNWDTDPTYEYLDRAFQYSDRLSERDRLRLEGLNAFFRGDSDGAEKAFRAIVRRYPDDADAWNHLGATHYFYNWKRGRPLEEARQYFEQARTLDPEDARNYWLLFYIYSSEGSYEKAERSIQRWFGDGSVPPWFRASTAFSGGDALAKARLIDELRNAPGFGVLAAASRVALHNGDLAGARRIARLLTDPQTRSPKIRATGHVILAHLAAAGGQWSVAKRELAEAEPLYPAPSIVIEAHLATAPFLEVPADELKQLRNKLSNWDAAGADGGRGLHRSFRFTEGMLPILRTYLLGLVSARLGDEGKAMAYATELEALPAHEHAPSLPEDLSRGVRAQLAWNQGEFERALGLLEQARMETLPGQFLYGFGSSFLMQHHRRFLRAEILDRLGREEEALNWYSSFRLGGARTVIYSAPTHLRRGEINEELGRQTSALEHYDRFIELWKDCDPELRPVLEDAKRRAARLFSKGARRSR